MTPDQVIKLASGSFSLWRHGQPEVEVANCEARLTRALANHTALINMPIHQWRALWDKNHEEEVAQANIANAHRELELCQLLDAIAFLRRLRDSLTKSDLAYEPVQKVIDDLTFQCMLQAPCLPQDKLPFEQFRANMLRGTYSSVLHAKNDLAKAQATLIAYNTMMEAKSLFKAAVTKFAPGT